MTKLEILRRQASVDAYVTLRLTRGEDVTGRIMELDNSYVCLDLGDGDTGTFFEDNLAGFEIHSGPDIEKPPLTSDPEVFSALARVKASFSEAIKRVHSVSPDPDFQFSEAGFPSSRISDIRRDWDRARNQYTYALKVKEIGRLNSIVVQTLAPMAKRYPNSAATKSLLGRMLLKLNRQSEAQEHLAAAAALTDSPEHWLALASMGSDDKAIECYALRKYFRLTPPLAAKETWFRYIAVAIDHHDLRSLVQIILKWSEQLEVNADLRKFLYESVIYLLSSTGAEPLALSVAASLVQNLGDLPEGWQSKFDHDPSDRLLAIEKKFSRHLFDHQDPKEPVGNEVPQGRIASFRNQRLGFIDTRKGETFFFRIDDVMDEDLKRVLLDGTWRSFGNVEFEISQFHGHKYNRATSVVPLQDSEALLQRARDLRHLRQYSKARAFVRRVLNANPTHQAALQLEEKLKEDLKKLYSDGAGLPKGNSLYARAKRAQFVDQDLDKAEKLFNEAIRKLDKKESAIKDLASLFQQRERNKEAIDLLEYHSRRVKGLNPYDRLLADVYRQTGRHDAAIRILNQLMNKSRPSKRGPLLKQIAYSYIRLTKYDEAEHILKGYLENNPGDRTAERWLAGIEDARNATSDAEAEELIRDLGGLAETGVELSSLAHAAIDRCTYEGVDPAKIRAGNADHKEVERVEELAKTLGTKRPRDRAAYYLSAAALLHAQDLGESGPKQIYDYFRRYFTSMADASWIEKKPVDVIRSYYIESLALVFDDNLDEAWRGLIRYLVTFSPKNLQDIEATFPRGTKIRRTEYVEALQKTLELIGSNVSTSFSKGLISIGSQSSFASDCLIEAIQANPSLQAMFLKSVSDHVFDNNDRSIDIRGIWQSKCREKARNYRKRLSICRTLTKYQATVSSMENLDAQLRDASESEDVSELDRRRLNALIDVVDSASKFCSSSNDFEEKERNFWLVTTQAEQFAKEVLDAPTQYSHEGLFPISEHIKSLIEEEYAQMARTSGAELIVELLVNEYLPGQEGELRLQIEIANKSGCSPASSVQICLGPRNSEYFDTDHWEREVVSTLRGGNTEVTQMIIHPRDIALRDRAFPIEVSAIYQNSLGEEVRTENHAWTVRLYQDEEFQYLDNPYSPFAEGGPVDNAEMFVGREELLGRLENLLLSGSGSKSIVIFGQKRAGKSSLIEHLRRRLTQRQGIVPVSFSLQDIAPELSIHALFYRILHSISQILEEYTFNGKEVPKFLPPDIDTLKFDTTLRFHDAMSSLVRDMARHSSNLKLVLLIDEFTEIFKEIRKKKIPSEFMKAWKAIIEKRYFASVLVGQDIMPAFKAEFSNEFGVTEDVRITYLTDTAAATLVEKPIGENRFAGRAVKRLLDLTAGSPYYTMMFCARLVDYMNTTRSVILTEADIRAVEEDMLRGDKRLTKDKFDNLLCAGDGVVDSGIDPEHTYAICKTIVEGSEKEGWCSRELMRNFDQAGLNDLLSDLETRDVVERKGTTYRLRVGLFRDWLARQG